jgi:hypothetical protein
MGNLAQIAKNEFIVVYSKEQDIFSAMLDI